MDHKSRIFTRDGNQIELVSDGIFAEVRLHESGPYDVICSGSAEEVYRKYIEYIEQVLCPVQEPLCETDETWEPIGGTIGVVVEDTSTRRGLFHRKKK